MVKHALLQHPPRHLFGVEAQPPVSTICTLWKYCISDDSDSNSNYDVPLHPFELQSESSEALETEAETDDSSDSFYHCNNNDAQHSDFIDMDSAERKLPVPSEDTNDGHCNNEDAVAAEDDAGGILPIDEELPPQEYASDINYSDAVEINGDDDDDDEELESLPA